MAKAMNARSEFPQPSPRALYMDCPARGRSAPTRERRTVFAASADAACMVYASIR